MNENASEETEIQTVLSLLADLYHTYQGVGGVGYPPFRSDADQREWTAEDAFQRYLGLGVDGRSEIVNNVDYLLVEKAFITRPGADHLRLGRIHKGDEVRHESNRTCARQMDPSHRR